MPLGLSQALGIKPADLLNDDFSAEVDISDP
jgi:hypothetical protein